MARTYGQYCGVGAALEVVGERWALLIVRDLLVGPRRYTDLKQGLPRIPTNILSARLRELQDAGVVQRAHLAHCGLVYELTEQGRRLEDVVLALGRWGFSTLDEPGPDDVVTLDSLTIGLRAAFRPEVAAQHRAATYEVAVGDARLHVQTGPDGLRIRPRGSSRPVDAGTSASPETADLVVAATPDLYRLFAGDLSPHEAIRGGVLTAVAGADHLLTQFAETFHPGSAVASRT